MKKPKHKSGRQSQRDANLRKAKARERAAKEYRSWLDRPRFTKSRNHPVPLPFSAGLNMAEMLARNPDLMDRLFGGQEPGPKVFRLNGTGEV